jgi:GxxExxY protein
VSLTKKYLDELTYEINGALIEVHKHMGPGLLESVYHKCLKHELATRGLAFKSEMIIPIQYKDMEEEIDFRCDFFVEESIIVEIKALSEILGIHKAQLLNYMKLIYAPKGILVNFNVEVLMRDGHSTFVNKIYGSLNDT